MHLKWNNINTQCVVIDSSQGRDKSKKDCSRARKKMQKVSRNAKVFYFICIWVLSGETEFLLLAPGTSICHFLFPADKHWLPSPSPPALPMLVLGCQLQKTVILLSSPLVRMSMPVVIWHWVADKEHTCSVNPSLGREKLKSRGGPPWIPASLLPLWLTVPRAADIWFTTLPVGSRELDSQIPLVKTPSQALPLSYLWDQWRSAPWLIIFPCRMRLFVDDVPASDLPGKEISWVQFLGLMPDTKEGISAGVTFN